MSIILSVIIGFTSTAVGFLVGYKTGYGDALRIVADDLQEMLDNQRREQ